MALRSNYTFVTKEWTSDKIIVVDNMLMYCMVQKTLYLNLVKKYFLSPNILNLSHMAFE